MFENGEKLVAERNKSFIEHEIKQTELFPPVEVQTLTEVQRKTRTIKEIFIHLVSIFL